MSTALVLHDLHKHFGATQVLRGLSLEVSTGECLALVGPNGAGKTTLFNLISGRHAPSRGQVRLLGKDISGLSPHAIARLGLARSFQVTQTFARLSVREQLRCACLASLGHGPSLFARLARMDDVQARTDHWLDRLGLGPRADTLAGELSYPEQRLLELGLTLASEPQVLLLDEPTAGMNRSEAAHAVALIREVGRGRTLIVVEHDMGVVFELADRIAVLDQGRLIACGSPAQVRSDPQVQQVYLGVGRGEGAC